MDQGYIAKKPLKQIDKNFTDSAVGTTVDQFIAQNFVKATSIPTKFEVATPDYIKISNSQNLIYLNDDGTADGRITLGVKSLVAITKTLKGIPANSLVLFDQVMYTKPYDFRRQSTEEARLTIATNFGITAMLPEVALVSQSVMDSLNNMSDRMTVDIRNGTFTFAKYINEALSVIKAVVKAAMNYKGA